MVEKISFCFPQLETLTLQGNPACPWEVEGERYKSYRLLIIQKLRNLKQLDAKSVSEQERKESVYHVPTTFNTFDFAGSNPTNFTPTFQFQNPFSPPQQLAFSDASLATSVTTSDLFDNNTFGVDYSDFQDFTSTTWKLSPSEFQFEENI